ncbi:MAG: hypothetical protein IJW41_05190 [Oscillospiraceae bacterium]|nr:hypothetical protein [Oscillospiraceae bacterium]MBQ7341543.1 hypothetical protein [Oscillospiraceae bacterium]
MAAKVRIKCPKCGEVENYRDDNVNCVKCKSPIDLSEGGNIYLYRQGSPFGIAGGFGIYLNNDPYGYIANRELIRMPLPYGTYNLHVAVGMNRRCHDVEITLSPENKDVYMKVYMKPGFISNTFVLVPVDPNLLDL